MKTIELPIYVAVWWCLLLAATIAFLRGGVEIATFFLAWAILVDRQIERTKRGE